MILYEAHNTDVKDDPDRMMGLGVSTWSTECDNQKHLKVAEAAY
jgi:hypothetical protein